MPAVSDLEARQEQEEREADQGEDRDREVGLDPAQPGRADGDAEHDLEHDRRKPQARKEAEYEWNEQRDRRADLDEACDVAEPLADADRVEVRHVERLQQVVPVRDQVRDDDLQDVNQPERQAGADCAFHHPFRQERNTHEPVRRADQLIR